MCVKSRKGPGLQGERPDQCRPPTRAAIRGATLASPRAHSDVRAESYRRRWLVRLISAQDDASGAGAGPSRNAGLCRTRAPGEFVRRAVLHNESIVHADPEGWAMGSTP